MDQTLYLKLADQVARQSTELAVLDSEIAALQPGVDALQAAVDAAKQAADIAQDALDAALAVPVAEGEAPPDTTAEEQAVESAQAALTAAQESLAEPKAELDGLSARADAIRAAIAQCQQDMADSGLNPTQAQLDAVRTAASDEAARIAAINNAIAGDAVITSLKGMTNAQFDTWWTNNVTTGTQAQVLANLAGVVKRLTRVVIRRLL